MAEGFIVISRRIKGWRWWHNPTARSFWLYILVETNWRSGYLRDGTEVQRGQLCRSLRNMAEDNHCSVNTIRYWLRKFEESGEITVTRAHQYQVINVINYAKYQDYQCTNGTTTDTSTDTTTDTSTDTTTDTDRTIRTIRTRKTIKPQYIGNTVRASFAPPSMEEVEQYISTKGYHFTADEFIAFYESNGWKVGRNPMKNWKAACTTWENRRMKSQPSAQKQQPQKAKTFLERFEELEKEEGNT